MVEFNAFLFIFILYFYIRKVRSFNLGGLLLGVYTVSSVFSVFFFHDPFIKYTIHNVELSIEPFLYLLVVLMIFFIPILRFNENNIKTFIKPNISKFKILAWLAIITSTVTVLLVIPFVLKNMSGDISLNRNDTMSSGGIKYTTNGFLDKVIMVARSLEKISMLMLFYCFFILKDKKLKLIQYLLIIPAIISPSLLALSYVARGPLLFLILLVFAMFFLFRKHMSNKTKKRFMASFISMGVVLMIVFAAITISRFGKSSQRTDDFGISFFFYKYAGENFVNFNGLLYNGQQGLMYGENCFPYFANALGIGNRTSLDEHRYVGEAKTGVPIWVFYTFVGDLCIDFGKLGTLIFAILISLISLRYIKVSDRVPFHRLTIYVLLYSTYLEGLFIFNLQGTNQTIIIAILIYIYLRVDLKNNQLLKA